MYNISVKEQDDRFQAENTTLAQGFNPDSFNLYFNNVQFFLECPLFDQQRTTLSEVIPQGTMTTQLLMHGDNLEPEVNKEVQLAAQ